MNYRCLIVDDEEMIAQSTCEYFNLFDVPSHYVTSYEECLDFLKEHQVELLLLDINLGDRSGFALCKDLRRTMSIPILFISARSSDDDILTALNIGGDDYITKPFSLNILLAKVKAVLRRAAKDNSGSATGESIHTRDQMEQVDGGDIPDHTGMKPSPVQDRIVLNENYRQVIVDSAPVRLKEMEFRLLKYLMENQGRVVTKEKLFHNVWGDSFVGDGTLSVHIRQLRQKIEHNPDAPESIRTLWGVGYIFEGKDL